jgi:hypothetical protein
MVKQNIDAHVDAGCIVKDLSSNRMCTRGRVTFLNPLVVVFSEFSTATEEL